MLEIKGVYKTFNPGSVNEKHALNGLDIVLNEGDFVTVIGGNGAGKSTFLNAVAGVWPVDAGKICIDGKDVTALPEYKRAKYLGRVFQDPMTGTAAKVLEITDKVIAENNLTAIMITHNMSDALKHGNRLIMMNDGKIIFDVSGEEKKNLTVEDLLRKFSENSGEAFSDDRAMLG